MMEHEISLPSREITLPASWHRLPLVAGAVGVLALAPSFGLGLGDPKQASFSYLAGFWRLPVIPVSSSPVRR